MDDRLFEARLDRLFGAYADQGVRPFDRHEIAQATITSAGRFGLLRAGLPRRWQLVFVAVVVLATIGTVGAFGARLLSLPRALPSSLLVLTPDSHAGTIRVFGPDGTVIGDVPGSTNGCDRLVLSADGRRLAWVFEGPPVKISSLDGLDRVSLPQGQSARGWAFSPDRTRVAYLKRTADAQLALAIASLADGSETVIATDLHGVQLSPLAWSSTDELALGVLTSTEVGVDVIAADGTNHRSLARRPVDRRAGVTWVAVSWSPNGTQLAYAGASGIAAPADTRIVDLATGASSVLETAAGQPAAPWTIVANSIFFVWSPDGRAIVHRVGDQQHALLDLATGLSRALPDYGFMPYWSPDGSHVALVRLSDPARLTVLRADLTDPVDLVVDAAITGIAWSPDSRRIAVENGSSIDLLDPSGAEASARIVTDVAAGYGCLSWWSTGAP